MICTVCSAPRVIQNMPVTQGWILGVTSVDDELFVLTNRTGDLCGCLWGQVVNNIDVFSINDYQLLRQLNAPLWSLSTSTDMTSCARHKCLYLSCCIHNYILRYDLVSDATTKWSVLYPGSISLTPSCNLLVKCWDPNGPEKLVELSADSGRRVREIKLQSDIITADHSIQLTTGQFLVSHSCNFARDQLHRIDSHSRDLHRVCVVGDDGKVTRSYGGQRGSDVGHLHNPCHLAVDKDSQFIFVADTSNNRVVLLSPTLEFVRYVNEWLAEPFRLYFHQSTRRLFVGQLDGDVTVIQL